MRGEGSFLGQRIKMKSASLPDSPVDIWRKKRTMAVKVQSNFEMHERNVKRYYMQNRNADISGKGNMYHLHHY